MTALTSHDAAQALLGPPEKTPLERARGFTTNLSAEANRIEREASEGLYHIRELPQEQKDAWAFLMREYLDRIKRSVEDLVAS
jgi:hypothetical protein